MVAEIGSDDLVLLPERSRARGVLADAWDPVQLGVRGKATLRDLLGDFYRPHRVHLSNAIYTSDARWTRGTDRSCIHTDDLTAWSLRREAIGVS
ncbi:hypothetical protein [Microbacterium murale]|uniref:Uncharacterized protein n=1 Tax=Microbacterium murale TaxID=1081040 RepID=A0ABU0P928_9MICO|nr:hypothetical protein [Microbacterium murale]MDQ0643847.1 hypothetical protein [Microbacterium murale]